ncbi:MAG: type II toxin-antitoxin system PemK/MazF family toxin [Candidatus Uhrbacteria bacterium]
MFERGTIILVPFPFTDLSSQKVRPAIILSRGATVSGDVIVAFISSVLTRPSNRAHVLIRMGTDGFNRTGLKVSSVIRCDKLATLDRRIVLGELGALAPASLRRVNAALRTVLGL